MVIKLALNKAQVAALLASVLALSACEDQVELDIQHYAVSEAQKQLQEAIIDPAKLCTDVSVTSTAGSVIKGTRDCKTPQNVCKTTGSTDCYLTDASFYGLDPAEVKPQNIRKGVQIGDIVGTAVAADELCTSDGQKDCVATTSFVSVPSATAASKVAVGETIATIPGTFVPDLPAASHVIATAQTGATAGLLPLCSAAVTSSCVLSSSYRAVPIAALKASDIKASTVIGAVTGTYVTSAPTCSAGNAIGCVTTSRYGSVEKNRVIATNLVNGYSVLGIAGSVLRQPAACTSDNEIGCLAAAPYRAIAKASLSAGVIRSGVTIAGVTGDYPSAAFPLPEADGGVADLTAATFNSRLASPSATELWDATGARHVINGSADLAAGRIIAGTTIFGVTGNLGTRPADCSADNETACVTVAAFPAIRKTLVTPGILRSGVTLAGVTGTYPSAATPLAANTGTADFDFPADLASGTDVEFFDATGTRHQVQGSADLTGANILSGVTLFGVGGTAVAKPGDCSAHNQTGCVAGSSFPAVKKSLLTANVIKNGVVLFGTTGNFPSAASRMSGASGTADLNAGAFNSQIATSANFEFWDATGLQHTVAGDGDLAAANILSGVTIFGIAGGLTAQPLDCSLTTTSCLTTTSHPSYDPAVLTEGLIKSGVAIGNVTGAYPSASYPLPDAVGSTVDLSASGFNARMASTDKFEYWDSTGARFTATGDSGLAATNLRQSTSLFGVTGTAVASAANCAAANADSCVTTASFPAYQKSNLTAAKIKNGTTLLGVTGTYPSAGNPLPSASGLKDLNSANFNSSMADSAGFEYWTSAGVYQTNHGDDDFIAANLRTTVSLFGVTGTLGVAPGNCTGSNQTSCMATNSFPAIDKDQVTEGVLKNGVTRLGVVGKYPSSAYPLPGATVTTTDDLTTAHFPAMIASTSQFEFFDSVGQRYISQGSSNLVPGNIKDGVNILGVTGDLDGESPERVWDIVHGASLGGAQGRVKTNCRNLASTSDFAGDGGNYASIDDENSFDTDSFPLDNTWGTDAAKCDDDTFQDLSYNSSTGLSAPCAGGSASIVCMFKDRISGLTWREASSGSVKMGWSAARSHCDNLTSGGHSDWRLPTMKEAMAAAVHGMHRLKIGYNVGSGNSGQTFRTDEPIWTSTAVSVDYSLRYSVQIGYGKLEKDNNSAIQRHSHCVR